MNRYHHWSENDHRMRRIFSTLQQTPPNWSQPTLKGWANFTDFLTSLESTRICAYAVAVHFRITAHLARRSTFGKTLHLGPWSPCTVKQEAFEEKWIFISRFSSPRARVESVYGYEWIGIVATVKRCPTLVRSDVFRVRNFSEIF